MQSVSAFQAQIAQIPPLREMLDVERKKWSTLQADVLRFGADIFHKPLNIWTGKKKRLLSCKLLTTSFGCILSTHSVREMRYYIRQSWNSMHMTENKPESAAIGCGGMGGCW